MLLLNAEEIPHAPSEHFEEAGHEHEYDGVDLGRDEGGYGEGPGAPEYEVGDDG